ncbi:hypothetical protein HK405_012089, partial [Cladochytrium tenue]
DDGSSVELDKEIDVMEVSGSAGGRAYCQWRIDGLTDPRSLMEDDELVPDGGMSGDTATHVP